MGRPSLVQVCRYNQIEYQSVEGTFLFQCFPGISKDLFFKSSELFRFLHLIRIACNLQGVQNSGQMILTAKLSYVQITFKYPSPYRVVNTPSRL